MASTTPQDALRHVVRRFRAYVEEARDSFADGFPRATALPSESRLPSSPENRSAQSAPGKHAAPMLSAIREDIGDCRRCKLCERRTQVVFGVGNPNAELMFVGEGPGEDEDRKGEPFVGRAGQLLTDIITRGMGLQRNDVYIANVVKCRPPGNRNPEPDEIAACQPFLFRQIDAVSPKVVVALGKFAAQTLLETATPISKLRGRWFPFRDRKLMATFHPSYLLRNPGDKKLVWEDVKLVMTELGLPLPKSS
jgi:uracil-DNA glycosylase